MDLPLPVTEVHKILQTCKRLHFVLGGLNSVFHVKWQCLGIELIHIVIFSRKLGTYLSVESDMLVLISFGVLSDLIQVS